LAALLVAVVQTKAVAKAIPDVMGMTAEDIENSLQVCTCGQSIAALHFDIV